MMMDVENVFHKRAAKIKAYCIAQKFLFEPFKRSQTVFSNFRHNTAI
jgi:hypothetical protein